MKYRVINRFKLSIFTTTCFILIASDIHASHIPSNIDLLVLRDLAENLGKFRAGNVNVPVYDKNGALLIVIKEPIPDFAASGKLGLFSLITPYIAVTAAHNENTIPVRYKGYTEYGYENDFTDSNSINKYYLNNFTVHPNYRNKHKTAREQLKADFAALSFDKLVTEVEPYTHLNFPVEFREEVKAKAFVRANYNLFARAGSGVLVQDGKRMYVSYTKMAANMFSRIYLDQNYSILTRFSDKHPLSGLADSGDSGSPLLIWNKNEWLLIGIVIYLHGDNDNNTYNLINKDFLQSYANSLNIRDYKYSEFIKRGHVKLEWKDGDSLDGSKDGLYNLNGDLLLRVPLEGNFIDKGNYRRNIILDSGSNEGNDVLLRRNIYQGSGFIEFKKNYSVFVANNDIYWRGAGLVINENVTVDWFANGVRNDDLHKIGKGILVINGSGDRKGNIKIGEGELHLNRTNGKAAENIILVSGRPTVKIINNDNLTGDNFIFGFRGGVLDLNGSKELNFTRIKHADYGARIINTKGNSVINLVGNSTNIFLGSFGVDRSKEANLTVNINAVNNYEKVGLLGHSNLNGDLNVKQGNTIIGATYTRHAESIHIPGDYQQASFTANNINVASNATLRVGIETTVNSNLNLESAAKAYIGFIAAKDSDNIFCSYEQGSQPKCQEIELSQDIFNNIETTLIGNIKAKDSSLLVFGKNSFIGSINADKNSDIVLTKDSLWLINKNSTVGNIINDGTIIFQKDNNKIISSIESNDTLSKELIFTGKVNGNGKILINIYADGSSDKIVFDLDNNNNINIGFNSIGKVLDKIKVAKITNGNNKINIDDENSTIDGFKYGISIFNNNIYLVKALNMGCAGINCFDNAVAELATYNDVNINALSNSNYGILNFFSSLSTNSNNVYLNADISSSSDYKGNYYLPTNQLSSYVHLGSDSNLLFSGNNFIGGALTYSSSSINGSINSNANILKGLLYVRLGLTDNLFLNSGIGLHYLKSNYVDKTNRQIRTGFNFIASLAGRINMTDELSLVSEASVEYYSLANSKIKYNLLSIRKENIKFNLYDSSIFKFRLGTRLSYSIESSSFYIASHLNILSGSTDTKVNNFSYNFEHERNDLSTLIGLNVKLNKNLTVDFNAGYTLSHNYKSSFLFAGSLKFNW